MTDLDWDFLPQLGYAIHDAAYDLFVLHELVGGALQPVSTARAVEVGIVDGGRLVTWRVAADR